MTDVDLLQAALAAEHATIYAYGVAGAHLSGPEHAVARTTYDGHRARRDRLAALVRDRGARPVESAAAYDLPFPVRGPTGARALLATVEGRLAAAYADLVLAGAGLAEVGARQLTEAAVRQAGWRGRGVAFPGLPERAAP